MKESCNPIGSTPLWSGIDCANSFLHTSLSILAIPLSQSVLLLLRFLALPWDDEDRDSPSDELRS